MRFGKKPAPPPAPKYPGIPAVLDGSAAVLAVETAAADAAAACPIVPAATMSDGWVRAAAEGATNALGRPLGVVEAESGHAAAAVAAGLAMTGLRACAFASGQAVAELHESLFAAAGKRLPWVLHVACRAISKQGLVLHAGHDDYHAVDDTGCFQLFARDAQEAADLALIAHRLAELSLTPGICAQDGFLTSHTLESLRLPERPLVREYLGDPADLIDAPTPAQRLVFGERRRRIPELFDLDYPAALGGVQGRESYAQGVAAQRPFYLDHVGELAERAFDEYAALTGRRYGRCTGYRLEDAEYVLVGQGSVVADAEAVSDSLRAARKLRVGVLDVTMFRPFPADLVATRLRGRRAAIVLERTDQPLAADPPLMREMRAALAQAVENWRERSATPPHAGVPSCAPDDVPDLASACFGLGGRAVRPGDLVAAVENMLEGAPRRRRVYLGVEFVRPETRLPKLQIWQEQLQAAYPHLGHLALPPAPDLPVDADGTVAVQVHALGGGGAGTLARLLALTAADLFGLSVKALPRPDPAPTGQPTAGSVVLARGPIRWNAEPSRVDVVLAPDPTALRRAATLAPLVEGGLVVLPGEGGEDEPLRALPPAARRLIKTRRLRVALLDASRIATEEVADPGVRRRVQALAFLGAFFRLTRLGKGGAPPETAALLRTVEARLRQELGQRAGDLIEPNLRVVRRGFAEARELDPASWPDEPVEPVAIAARPTMLDGTRARPGLAHPGRFWEQVGFLHATGAEPIADPFAAVGVLPAATSTLRDLTDLRLEVPAFVPARCTGCGQCWTHCPDSAVAGLVTPVDQVIEAALRVVAATRPADRLRQLVRPLAAEVRRLLRDRPFTPFEDALAAAYPAVVDKLDYGAERRAALDAELAAVRAVLADAPLAKTPVFYDGPEAAARGTGGVLSVTINPETCKGCRVCVDVCAEGALSPVPQTDAVVERLRRSWRLWQELPETDERYVAAASRADEVGPLAALLLEKAHHLAMLGGDIACAGCGEKTALHLVLAAVQAHMRPRVQAHVARLDELIARLDDKARRILASDADLGQVKEAAAGLVDIPLEDAKQAEVRRIAAILRGLRDLRWRYTEGPSGRGRATCGLANATGCSAAWGSRFPFNPFPVPWVHHLAQDAASLALGLFEGQMRKMADGFRAVRRAELEVADGYDPATVEVELARLDWRGFTEAEWALCPPILAVGGDGAMLDLGLRGLSRLLASGRPIRVVVLDSQGYASTGGQPGGAGLPGQGGPGAGPGGHGEARKEPALLALAHRNVFILQSCQAAPAHLLAGVLRGLSSPYPAVFSLYAACPPVHGTSDAAAPRAARLALESRLFPLLVYDPAAGDGIGDRLSLEGNPAVDAPWAAYDLRYADETGAERAMRLPVTVADWAATEGRFRRHFTAMPAEDAGGEAVPFHDYVALPAAERAGKRPFLYTLEGEGRLGRRLVGEAIVRLADDRQEVWRLLRELAGRKAPQAIALEAEFERKLAAVRAESDAKLAELRARYPRELARRFAERLLRPGNGAPPVGELLDRLETMPRPAPDTGGVAVAPAPPVAPATAGTPAPAAVAVAPAAEPDEPVAIDPSIDSALCTACNECTNLNKRMFAYNAKKQAYIKDPRAGTFRQLVLAAEKCPVKIIHPGTPLDPKEKDVDKWIARAKPFN